MALLYFLAIVLFFFLCLLLSVVVLVQESKSSGFGASFGGDAGDSVFGVSTPQVLKTCTTWLAVCFLVGCIILSFWTSSRNRTLLQSSAAQQALVDQSM